MFEEYPHVEITFLNYSGDKITAAVCEYCGAKNLMERLYGQSSSSTAIGLQTIENQAKINQEYNGLWKEIEAEKIDHGIALYKLEIIRRKRENDTFLKRGGTSEIIDRLVGSCEKCGKPVGANIHAVSKVWNEMPNDINFYLKKLAPPPREMIARALEDLGGGTVETQLARIEESQYKKLGEFTAQTRTELLKLSIDYSLTEQFDSFLQEYQSWVQEQKNERNGRFWNAIQKVVEQMAISGLPPSLYERLTQKVEDLNDKLHGRTGLLLGPEDVKEAR
jgi:hypothetical protein